MFLKNVLVYIGLLREGEKVKCSSVLRVYNLLITYNDDDDDDETEKPTLPMLKTCEWEQY